jgi:UTP--glucose-1-phosphate uridylyltransferase
MKNKDAFESFKNKMAAEGMPDIAIENFRHYYQQLVEGVNGMISESSIDPINSVTHTNQLHPLYHQAGKDALSKTVMIKLNGGLGTSMGLEKAKSLIKVKGNKSFLDIIAEQSIHSDVPLVLMNSFSTHEDSINSLEKYNALRTNQKLFSFIQHKVPKILQSDLTPAEASQENHLEWCPPGHGDLYSALLTSGTLSGLLKSGYKYAFISNSDNLGAVLDKSILGYFSMHNMSMLMEVADRTEADKKGGHLARALDGSLTLRESAQCIDKDKADFEDIDKHKYFNTNNIWINLHKLRYKLQQHNNVLPLPMICNQKTLNPRDNQSAPVYQLETAMGAAINVFKDAGAICVSRERFIPVKTTSDLLLIRSNLYTLSSDSKLVKNPKVKGPMPLINLDDRYFKKIDDYERRFGAGEPNLLMCRELTVNGDIVFGEKNTIRGVAHMINYKNVPLILSDRTTYSGKRQWS